MPSCYNEQHHGKIQDEVICGLESCLSSQAVPRLSDSCALALLHSFLSPSALPSTFISVIVGKTRDIDIVSKGITLPEGFAYK